MVEGSLEQRGKAEELVRLVNLFLEEACTRGGCINGCVMGEGSIEGYTGKGL